MFAYLGEQGFTSSPGNRVHRHRTTGARVVVHNPHAAGTDAVDIAIHAPAGAWFARLTRAPGAAITATITAALNASLARRGEPS
ncbi:hypothetical protein [Actinokineospora sp. NPDC004072]